MPAIIEPEPRGGFIRIIASIVLPDGELRIFPLSGTFDEYALAGPSSLIRALHPALGQRELQVAEWSEEFPDQGFHMDTRRRIRASTALYTELFLNSLLDGVKATIKNNALRVMIFKEGYPQINPMKIL